MAKQIYDSMAMKRALTRMTYEIIEKNKGIRYTELVRRALWSVMHACVRPIFFTLSQRKRRVQNEKVSFAEHGRCHGAVSGRLRR